MRELTRCPSDDWFLHIFLVKVSKLFLEKSNQNTWPLKMRGGYLLPNARRSRLLKVQGGAGGAMGLIKAVAPPASKTSSTLGGGRLVLQPHPRRIHTKNSHMSPSTFCHKLTQCKWYKWRCCLKKSWGGGQCIVHSMAHSYIKKAQRCRRIERTVKNSSLHASSITPTKRWTVRIHI